MARTIAQIQQAIITAKEADSTLSALSSSSNVSIWLLWTYVVAVCQWVLENLYDSHKVEVATLLAAQKPHTLQWYVTKAKLFQYGVALPNESDTYTSISTDLGVSIVQYAAAVELPGLVRVKVTTIISGALAPISSAQLTAVTAYMNLVKDAGVLLQVTSGAADTLQLGVHIYYDPLVFDIVGERLDGTSTTPVMDAVKVFLQNLPFNGHFVINNLIGALQAINGVVIGEIMLAQATHAALPYTTISSEYIPDSGYMVLDESYFLANASYTAHEAI
jgi:hypothetical protein